MRNKMIEHKDEEIIALMKNSEEKGLRLMMNTYQSRLYWHIKRLVFRHETAQDILQETFIKAYRNFSSFKEQSRLYTWLYRIATNESLYHLDKQKKMPQSEDVEEYFQNTASSTSAPNAEEVQILLKKAISKLPEKQRLVFTMRYYDDLPYEDIAQILEMSVGTLKTNYHYAKEKIEQYIIEHAEEF